MYRVVIVAGLLAAVAVLQSVSKGWASLYSPQEPMAIPVEDGKPVPLPFEEFKRRLTILRNALVEPLSGEKDNPDRQAFLQRIAEASGGKDAKKTKRLTAEETAALATDLIRVGQLDQALDNLSAKMRPANYWVLTTLGHVHAARGDWAQAIELQMAARLDTEMPEMVKGLTKGQRDWWEKLDRDYLPHYYQINKQYLESRRGISQTELEEANRIEEPLPLFPLPVRSNFQNPVRFVNDAGEYQPGNLASAERAKLPPDALAIVQQLLLWFPLDVRLYWLLGELYAANGDLDSAAVIFDECTWSGKYGNRQVLRDHRQAIRAAIEARPKPKPPEPPISMRTILIYFGVIGLIGVIALIRSLTRRSRLANPTT